MNINYELPDVVVVETKSSYGTAAIVTSGPFFVDMDHEVATELPPGRYRIIPVSDRGWTGDPDGDLYDQETGRWLK